MLLLKQWLMVALFLYGPGRGSLWLTLPGISFKFALEADCNLTLDAWMCSPVHALHTYTCSAYQSVQSVQSVH